MTMDVALMIGACYDYFWCWDDGWERALDLRGAADYDESAATIGWNVHQTYAE